MIGSISLIAGLQRWTATIATATEWPASLTSASLPDDQIGGIFLLEIQESRPRLNFSEIGWEDGANIAAQQCDGASKCLKLFFQGGARGSRAETGVGSNCFLGLSAVRVL